MLNFTVIVILLFTRPYKDATITWVAIFNEIMIFIISCYLFAFLIVDLEGLIHAGYAQIITNLLITLIVANLLIVLLQKLRELYFYCVRCMRIRRLKNQARQERRFREFDTMRYVLHGLHLKDYYRFRQRKRMHKLQLVNETKSSLSELSDEAQITAQNQKKNQETGLAVYERVSNAIKKRYSSTFSQINKSEESGGDATRQIMSAEG